jgi:hypothetical protein
MIEIGLSFADLDATEADVGFVLISYGCAEPCCLNRFR